MASGHVNRANRPNTWLHRPMLHTFKKVFANSEPSGLMRMRSPGARTWPLRRLPPDLQGVPAGIAALILGLQPIVTSTLANRFMGEKVTRLQWVGLALGLVGVLLVLHDRNIVLAGFVLWWVASFLSLIGITLGTLYQKRYCGGIDWRTGNLIQ